MKTLFILFLIIGSTINQKNTFNYACYSSAEPQAPLDPAGLIKDYTGFNLIQVDQARAICSGDNTVRVGIVDSGIDINNPNLTGLVNEELSKDFSNPTNEEPFKDWLDHGTAVASLVCSTMFSIKSICRNLELVSLKVNALEPEMAQITDAINYAATNGIDILNICINFGQDTEAFRNAVQNFPGLIVNSAGNRNDSRNLDISTTPSYPSSYDYANIISVGSMDNFCSISSFSNYGQTVVDLFAPGENLPAARAHDFVYNYYCRSGTSFSTPLITGTCALIKSMYPDLNYLAIKDTVLSNVVLTSSLNGNCVTGGYLNVYNCLINPHTHTFFQHKCTVCQYERDGHDFSRYEWKDYDSHKLKCDCGQYLPQGHTVLPGAFSHGETYAICIYCHGRARAGFTPTMLGASSDSLCTHELTDEEYMELLHEEII